MLKDIRELGKDLKEYFNEIRTWPELTFNQSDKAEIAKIPNVTEVDDHSITFRVEENHSIVPSQYILYTVLVKEFANALRDHLDVFEKYKNGKTKNEIGEGLFSEEKDFRSLALDDWSRSIALKPLYDKEYNFEAKSIINGSSGAYKIRGHADFFTSVILKIINVPDASSAILGRIIYSLTEKKETYNYLEKRFNKHIPFLIKEGKSNHFAYKVFSFLFQYDNLSKLKKLISVNSDTDFRSIKAEGLTLTSIFKASVSLLKNEDLLMGDKPRFFVNPIHLNENNEFYYFSTEWTNGTNRRLDIESLKAILKIYYPEFQISQVDGKFLFHAASTASDYSRAIEASFNITSLAEDLSLARLIYDKPLILRFSASLLTKPFLILTGLSGSGKTKLAQAFAQWICQNNSQYKVIPIGADWTNREPLLGYPNGLDPKNYVSPESGALDLILAAKANQALPYFMILDEMNLSHVERYFADFLSIMESDDTLKLYSGAKRTDSNNVSIENEVKWPDNLFIIGTVNIDETTYMFSPKVLDRANVIEFRISPSEMSNFLGKSQKPVMTKLFVDDTKEKGGLGQSMAKDFMQKARDTTIDHGLKLDLLNSFFRELQNVGAEFGYRTASEMELLLSKLSKDLGENEKIDIAIMQKLLPKLHGSRTKLIAPLETLAGLCLDKSKYEGEESGRNLYKKYKEDKAENKRENIIYPLSFEKLERMHKSALENGFTSYAEA